MFFFIQGLADNAVPIFTGMTVVILFYYTRETYLLRTETQKQTEHLFTPYLSVRNSEDGLKVINLGKGIAKDVRAIGYIPSSGTETVSIKVTLPIPTIGPTEERYLYYMDGENAWHLHASMAPDDLRLTYSDTLGFRYKTEFKKTPGTYGLYNETSQMRVSK